MPVTTADKRATFRTMHETGCFVLPNPYDVGSAKALAHLGFKAIASTSAGFAWTIGKADNRVTLDEVCAHLATLCGAVAAVTAAKVLQRFFPYPSSTDTPAQAAGGEATE